MESGGGEVIRHFNPLPKKLGWLENYLIKDCGILLVWDGNGKFSCPPEIRRELGFLN